MSGDRTHADHLDDPGRPELRAHATPEAQVARKGPAVVSRLAAGDPAGAGAAGSAASGLLALQRTAGNAAVTSILAPAVQRSVTIDEIETSAEAPTGGDPENTNRPEGGGDPENTNRDAGGPVTITGTSITLESPMVNASGVLRASTIIADNVVGTNYTPGAGNAW
ncbi:MAG: hypothetical protein WCK58_01385 [Chloroflexota bacterium]